MPRGIYKRKQELVVDEHPKINAVPVTVHAQGIFDSAAFQGYDWCEVTIDFFKEGKKVKQLCRQEGWRRP